VICRKSDDRTTKEIVELAAVAEKLSEHAVAKAIIEKAELKDYLLSIYLNKLSTMI